MHRNCLIQNRSSIKPQEIDAVILKPHNIHEILDSKLLTSILGPRGQPQMVPPCN